MLLWCYIFIYSLIFVSLFFVLFSSILFFFFFTTTPPTVFYSLSLHDALPILFFLCKIGAFDDVDMLNILCSAQFPSIIEKGIFSRLRRTSTGDLCFKLWRFIL